MQFSSTFLQQYISCTRAMQGLEQPLNMKYLTKILQCFKQI